jgi:outer membrane protein assembly factor BamE
MQRVLIVISFSIILTLVSGCSFSVPSFYKTDIRQGNYIDQAMIQGLKPGMTKSQVQLLLGSPLLTDPFHTDRWDYVYYFQRGNDSVEQRHISLFFEGEVLSRLSTSP